MFDSKVYYKKNKERIKEYRKKNRDKNIEYQKKHYEENKEEYSKNNKIWRDDNSEYAKEYQKIYHEENIEYFKEYNNKNKERIAKRNKEYNIKYPEKRVERNNHPKNKKQHRICNWKKVGLIAPNGDWDSLYELREKTTNCKICGRNKDEFKNNLVADHCHTTGIFRGFICNKCNLLLGLAKDDIETLKKAIKYLENKEC